MGYLNDISLIAETHREEVENELDRARSELMGNELERNNLESRIGFLERLLELASGTGDSHSGEASGSSGMDLKLHEAMVVVIQDSPLGKLRAVEIAQEIDRRRLYKMRDGRPVEAQQIHARIGHYRHLFEKEGSFIKLANR